MAGCTFLGLGVMGFPMAGHLQAAGYDLTVWNRTAAKAQAWAGQHGGKYSDTVEAAVGDADVVMMCLGDDPDVRAIADFIWSMPLGITKIFSLITLKSFSISFLEFSEGVEMTFI